MKSFKDYLLESVRETHYAIKLGMNPTDEQVSIIEKYLKKYTLVKFEKPVHVKQHVDFFNVKPHETWQIEAIITKPISSYILMQELKAALNIPEDYIVVRGAHEPVQLYADDCEFDCETDEYATKNDLESAARLSTDRFYNDVEQPLLVDLFGDEYNKRFLDYLSNVSNERPTDQYEAPAPLFSWIDMDKVKNDEVNQEDFNKNYDTPKPVVKGKGKNIPPVKAGHLDPSGNLNDTSIQRTRLLKNKDGKREGVSAPRARLKAGKE